MNRLQVVIALGAVSACTFADSGGFGGEVGAGPDAGAQPSIDAGDTSAPDAAPAVACVGKAGQPQDAVWTIAHGGRERTVRVHVPASYVPSQATPLWLNFHGYAMNAEWQAEVTALEQRAETYGAIVVHPEGTGAIKGWNAGACCGSATLTDVDDVGFVEALLDRLEDELCVDGDRVFASGFSNGGFLSHRLACELAPRIAAIATVSGVMGIDDCAPARPVPVLSFHGTSDLTVPYEGSWVFGFRSEEDSIAGWVERNGCTGAAIETYAMGDARCVTRGNCTAGADVGLCTIDGGGHQWPGGEAIPASGKVSHDLDASDAIWAFFAAHPRP
ncbi:MAG: PHB depolymerase family esterase [Kofleriaceae bacterium]